METKLIYLVNQQKLVSQIDEVGSELGETDCKLVSPFLLNDYGTLEQFLLGATKDTTFMISSDKILTLAEPTPTLLEKYQDLTKE